MNLTIYGFKHSGKTAYAKFLADSLGVNHVDIDEMLSDNYNEQHNKFLAAPDIFEELGEEKFRELEREALEVLLHVKDSIISASGGSMLNEDNVAIYNNIGKLCYLNASKETLEERETMYHDEGLITPGELKYKFDDIYMRRARVYHQVSDFEVTVHDRTAEEIIAELTKYWHQIQTES